MNESNTNGPVPSKGLAQADKAGDTITVTCDELVEFEENGSQAAGAWPWPEPPFVPETKRTKPKV